MAGASVSQLFRSARLAQLPLATSVHSLPPPAPTQCIAPLVTGDISQNDYPYPPADIGETQSLDSTSRRVHSCRCRTFQVPQVDVSCLLSGVRSVQRSDRRTSHRSPRPHSKLLSSRISSFNTYTWNHIAARSTYSHKLPDASQVTFLQTQHACDIIPAKLAILTPTRYPRDPICGRAGCSLEDLVRIRDEAAPSFIDFCIRQIDWARFALVGFSVVFQQLLASLALSRALKQHYPNLPVELVTERIRDSDNEPAEVVSPSAGFMAPVQLNQSAPAPKPSARDCRVPPGLDLCRGCDEYIWPGERSCPHCGSDVAEQARLYAIEQHRRADLTAEVRRLIEIAQARQVTQELQPV